jgi:putative phosphoribosyl transferase
LKEAAHLPYADRREAGRVLAGALEHLRERPALLVLALPRGGVAVGYEVAQALHAALDVIIVRKLGFPGHEEYAMGAIASGGVRVMNAMPGLHVSAAEIERVAAAEDIELRRREALYRGDAPPLRLAGRTVVIVDDGLATGATMRAAAMAVRRQQPAHLCVAAPVGAPETCHAMREVADEVVCPAQPLAFRAVGLWYRHFPQSTDDEVRELLELARAHPA